MKHLGAGFKKFRSACLTASVLLLALVMAACSSSSENNSDNVNDNPTDSSNGSPDGSPGSEEVSLTLQTSCERVNVEDLQQTGGVIDTVLPADLSGNGAQLVLSDVVDELIDFNPATGNIRLAVGGSRLARSLVYEVHNADGEAVSQHEHRWVMEPVRVMPLGDSITSGIEFFDGTEFPPMPDRVGYRQFLYNALTDAGYSIDYLGQGGQSAGAAAGLIDPENNGYPGVDIDFLNSKLYEQLAEDAVDIILLHIGTNNTPDNAQGIDDWLDLLDAWEAENNPVVALVATIVPKRDPALNAIVDLFNADLRSRIAARTNDRVVLVEQNLALTVDDISTETIGLHPSSTGYEKMANTWQGALISSNTLRQCE